MPRQRPTLTDSRYELDGFSFNAKQFDAGNDEIDSHLVLRDVASFVSVPVFEDSNGISLKEDDCSLTCDGRMLSATMIWGHWVDYSDPAIWTEEVAKKFETTLYLNHGGWSGPKVEEWIGAATNPRLSTKGILGVDATFKIDKKRDMVLTQGAICEGMKHSPPTVKSFSVGINHKLKKSHQFEDPWEFWEKLGTEVDGRIVCFQVTSIERIRECSLVYAGADPNARAYSLNEKIDFRAEIKEEFERLKAQIEPSAASAALKTGDRQMPLSPMMQKAIKALTGLDYSEETENEVIPAIYSVKTSADSVVKLKSDFDNLDKQYSSLLKSERDRLMTIGLTEKKNLNDDMKEWAESLPIEKLRKHVESAKSLAPPDVKPAGDAMHKEGQFIVPSLPGDLSHSDVELIASKMGMDKSEVYRHATKVQN